VLRTVGVGAKGCCHGARQCRNVADQQCDCYRNNAAIPVMWPEFLHSKSLSYYSYRGQVYGISTAILRTMYNFWRAVAN